MASVVCPKCHSENIYTRTVRRQVPVYQLLKKISAAGGLVFAIIGLVLVFIFSDESSFTIISNQLLGLISIALACGLAIFAATNKSRKAKVRKHDCGDCKFRWESSENGGKNGGH